MNTDDLAHSIEVGCNPDSSSEIEPNRAEIRAQTKEDEFLRLWRELVTEWARRAAGDLQQDLLLGQDASADEQLSLFGKDWLMARMPATDGCFAQTEGTPTCVCRSMSEIAQR